MRNNHSFFFSSIFGAGTICSFVACNSLTEKDSPPNVILILTDDQGYGDFSVHGNPVLKTPVLDRLHDESIRLTDFHVAPMSSPTRGQLLTGRDAMDNGATAVCTGRSMVREDLPTMADIFKLSGYNTAHFGKWHLGDSYPYRPQDRGFEETVHHGAWGITSIADYYGNTYWDNTFEHNSKYEKFDGYCTDVWFDLTIDFIRKSQEDQNPFFIYLATNCPHVPNLCDDKYSDPYLKKGMTPVVSKFFGQIANIDENMQRLITTLDETDLSENTILIYMTDNGTATGYDVFNDGMRGHKTSPYEGGHRVPFFIRWPDGKLGKPRDINELTAVQDVLPTLIDLCDLKKPGNTSFDGISLAPLLTGEVNKLDDRILVVEYENPSQPKENKAVLWNKWRLVKDTELYDLSVDPGQMRDIVAQYPEILKKMQDYYKEWRKNTLPDYDKTRYIHIGSDKQNPLMLYSNDWVGSYADNPGNLIAGDRIGSWEIIVENAGKYEVTLSRWHPVSGVAFNAPSIVSNKEGGAIPVAQARLKIGDFDKTIITSSGQTEAEFVLDLNKGTTKIETWFLDNTGKPLCSAYYTKVELIN
jgi:arylsulfatase